MTRAALADRWSTLWRPAPVSPPRLSRWAWAADAVLAVLLAAATVNGTLAVADGGGPAPAGWAPAPLPPAPPPLPPDPAAPSGPDLPAVPPLGGLTLVLYLAPAVLTALPLAVRRRYPLGAFWAVSLAALAYHHGPAFDPTFTFVSCVIAAYGAAVYSPYRRLMAVSVLAAAVPIVVGRDVRVPEVRSGMVVLLALIPIGLAANAVHTWKQRVRELKAEQEAATRAAVERERSRIAQELHDVVTHNVSVMVVQAGAARMTLREAPERAETALRAVESGGRAAMTELRHVMDLLTMDGDAAAGPDAADLAPRPGLDQVPALVERVRGSGVPVGLSVSGAAVPVPDGMDLAAYRVVQESLTNAVKHAGGARVEVAVEYAPGLLRVEVTDTGGRRTPAARTGGGRGLIGLRERLAVYGGTLQSGRRPGGGYRVCAVLPLEASGAAEALQRDGAV